MAAKSIREFLNVYEKEACSKCRQVCKFRDLEKEDKTPLKLIDVYLLLYGVVQNNGLKIGTYSSATTLLIGLN
jgi:hypothetical protein